MLAPLLWFLLVARGVTLLVTESRIAEPLRRGAARLSGPLGVLVHCPMCFGFWAGVGLSLALWSPSGAILGAGWPWRAIFDGAASSAVCWGAYVLERAAGSDRL